MSDVTMAQASIDNGFFYVPQFELRIDKTGLDPAVLRDIIEITFTDKIDEIDSCAITVNNWDADLQRFKYIGSEDLDDDGNPKDAGAEGAEYWNIFDPCSTDVELYLGYSGMLEQMMVGNFVTLEPSFPAAGGPTLQVRMLSQLHRLRRKKYDDAWGPKPGIKVTDSYIAKDIDGKRDKDFNNEKRFPLDIKIDDEAAADEPELSYVGQKNQYDIDFLWKRARINGYVVTIEKDENGVDKNLYFGRSKNSDDDPTVYKLEWGQSLIDLRATITTANQYRSVTVRGWDRSTQKPIEAKVDLTDKELAKLNPDLQHLVNQCDPREEYVAEMVVANKKEAEAKARALLLDQSKRMVKVSGTTIGLPKLRAGSNFKLGASVGSRLKGTYFVTSTTHSFSNTGGYTTKFEARREDLGDDATDQQVRQANAQTGGVA